MTTTSRVLRLLHFYLLTHQTSGCQTISGEFNVQQHLYVLIVQLEHIHKLQHLQHVHNVMLEHTVNKQPVHVLHVLLDHIHLTVVHLCVIDVLLVHMAYLNVPHHYHHAFHVLLEHTVQC